MTTPLLMTTLVSLLTLTGVSWLLHRTILPRLCPLCAGVTGTWVGLLAAHWTGFQIDLRVPALLLGGSVAGLAGLGETAMTRFSPGQVLAWKTSFFASGFFAAYALLSEAWTATVLGSLLLIALLGIPWLKAPRPAEGAAPQRREGLLKHLKNCC
jgi:hypothetical protein